MMDDFSNAPQSIAELRASRSESAKDWTPRDALIATLRDIDNGKIDDMDGLVIVYGRKRPEGRSVHYSVASESSTHTLGLISRFVYEYNEVLSK